MNLLTSLRYLVSLNEHKHFGRAAQACHITQPALSNALRALEKELDVVIVKRDRTFSGFTPEGEKVLVSAHGPAHRGPVCCHAAGPLPGHCSSRVVHEFFRIGARFG